MSQLVTNPVSVQSYIVSLAERFDQADLYYGHGTDNAFDEAVYLVLGILSIAFETDLDLANVLLDDSDQLRLEQAALRRINDRTPTAYLVGSAWFAGHRFISNENALVPRSPIAELINNRFEGVIGAAPKSLLDMCTGSGCIGIAAALEFDQATAVLADISKACIELATQNIQLHKLEQRVVPVLSDGFAAIDGKFDLILANPPYVSDSEYSELPQEYFAEPALGLVSARDGLALPMALMRSAAKHLHADGVLIMEVGYSAEALMQALPAVPFLWLEFDYGGAGVFSLTAEQLRTFSANAV
ncbi:MAG: ribosomal protein L3 glutamine methyltransferase [Pseudohongiellaceae bacterium]|jgi:ribosomal protein L3 glutamine methyltransferase